MVAGTLWLEVRKHRWERHVTADPRQRLIDHVRDVQQRWRRLAADVPDDRMEEPGAMGEWTFKDVAAHLTACGDPQPPSPWPAALGNAEDDPINAWIHDQHKDRPLPEVLAEADRVYDDFAAAVVRLPAEILIDADRFDWMEGVALADGDFGGHLGEHEPDVRSWLAEE
jgi:hypothetical protein